MRHDTARELLPLHAIGVVRGSDASEIRRHVATCRQCSQESEIYAFGVAALDAIAGADPRVLHSSDPLPPLSGAGLDRIAADVFGRLGSYAPQWTGTVTEPEPAATSGTWWGLTADDDDTAGDLLRGIADEDSFALQDSAAFADSVTLYDIEGSARSGSGELSGQRRGADGWVGPGDAAIAGLADEEWPRLEGDIPLSTGPAAAEWNSPSADSGDAEDDAAPLDNGPADDDRDGSDDWADLAKVPAPPAAALLDEATALRNVISRLKANSGATAASGGETPAPERGASAGLEPTETAPLTFEAPSPAGKHDQRPPETRRLFAGLFSRSRRAEPVDGDWDDLFQAVDSPIAAEAALPPPEMAPMLAGEAAERPRPAPAAFVEDPDRPPLTPSWLAHTATEPLDHGPAEEPFETLDSWAEIASTTPAGDREPAAATFPEALLDEPVGPDVVGEIPPLGTSPAFEAGTASELRSWVPGDEFGAGTADIEGPAGEDEAEPDDAAVPANERPDPEQTAWPEPRMAPEDASAGEADEDHPDDDWASLFAQADAHEAGAGESRASVELADLPGEAARGQGALDAPGQPEALHQDDRAPAPAAAPDAAVAPEVAPDEDEGDVFDDWADLFNGTAQRIDDGPDVTPVPVTAEAEVLIVPAEAVYGGRDETADAAGEGTGEIEAWPVAAADERPEDTVAAVSGHAVEHEAASSTSEAEPTEVAEVFADDGDIVDDWADLFSGAVEAVEEEPEVTSGVGAVAAGSSAQPVQSAADIGGGVPGPADEPVERLPALADAQDSTGALAGEFTDDWAGLALQEEEQQRAADEAFALAALDAAVTVRGEPDAPSGAVQGAAEVGRPTGTSTTRRFGFLRRGRQKEQDGSSPPAEAGTASAPGAGVRIPEEASAEAREAAELAAEPGAVEDAGGLAEPADAWSDLIVEAGAASDLDEGLSQPAEATGIEPSDGDEPVSMAAAAEASGADLPVERTIEAPGVAEQPSLFGPVAADPSGDEPAGMADFGAGDAAPGIERPGDGVDAANAVAALEVELPEPRRGRRFGWLRRAIPGGEDIEDDWAAVARAPREGTAEASTVETAAGAEGLELADETADAIHETGEAGSEGRGEDALSRDEADVDAVEVPERPESARPAVDEAEPDLAAAGYPDIGDEGGAGVAGGEMNADAPESVPASTGAAVSDAGGAGPDDPGLARAGEDAGGSLEDLFAEPDDDEEAGSRERSRQRVRRPGWFRSRRRNEAAEPEQDAWAAMASEGASGAPGDAAGSVAAETASDSGLAETDAAPVEEETGADQAARPLAVTDTPGTGAEALGPEVAAGDGLSVAGDADVHEPAVEGTPGEEHEEGAGIEAAEAGDTSSAAPQHQAPPPSRHRLREMVRRRRTARSTSERGDEGDGSPAGEPAEAAPESVPDEPVPGEREPEPEPSYLVDELEELAPSPDEGGRARRRRGTGPGRRHPAGDRDAQGAQRGTLRRALRRQRDDGEDDEEPATSPWAEVLRRPERPPSAPLPGTFATPYIPGPVDWGLERYDDDEPETDEVDEAEPSSWRFWTVMFAITTVVLLGLVIGGIFMLVNLRQESQQLEVAKDAAAVPLTFTSAVDAEKLSGEGYLEREQGRALITLKGITGAEQGQQYVIWSDNGAGTVTPVAWTTGRASSTVQYIPLNRVPRDVQRLYITLETFSGRPEAPPTGEILLEAPTP